MLRSKLILPWVAVSRAQTSADLYIVQRDRDL